MKGCGSCFLVILGLFGIFISITLSFTFYLLPFAFLFFIGSLILISFALGPAGQGNRQETDRQHQNHDEGTPPGER